MAKRNGQEKAETRKRENPVKWELLEYVRGARRRRARARCLQLTAYSDVIASRNALRHMVIAWRNGVLRNRVIR